MTKGDEGQEETKKTFDEEEIEEEIRGLIAGTTNPKNSRSPNLSLALEELEEIRIAFLDFQEVINATVFAEEVKPRVNMLASVLKSLFDLLTYDIDVEKLTEQGLKDYNKAEEVKKKILSAAKAKNRKRKKEDK